MSRVLDVSPVASNWRLIGLLGLRQRESLVLVYTFVHYYMSFSKLTTVAINVIENIIWQHINVSSLQLRS